MDQNNEKVEICPGCGGRKEFWANDGKYMKRRWVKCKVCNGKGYRDGNDLLKVANIPLETNFKLFMMLCIFHYLPNALKFGVVTQEDINLIKSGRYKKLGW